MPSTAVFIQQAMGEQESGIPAFDMDATCLSFLNGLDVISYMVDAGRYHRVLLVATEIASAGLNWSDKESAALFGDGAAAVIIERSEEEQSSRIVHASLKTYSRGRDSRKLPVGVHGCMPPIIWPISRSLTFSHGWAGDLPDGFQASSRIHGRYAEGLRKPDGRF